MISSWEYKRIFKPSDQGKVCSLLCVLTALLCYDFFWPLPLTSGWVRRRCAISSLSILPRVMAHRPFFGNTTRGRLMLISLVLYPALGELDGRSFVSCVTACSSSRVYSAHQQRHNLHGHTIHHSMPHLIMSAISPPGTEIGSQPKGPWTRLYTPRLGPKILNNLKKTGPYENCSHF